MNVGTEDFLDHPGIFIDVRSPGEFVQGHIPSAVNLPLFSNEERAFVGTAYKKKGREEAILLGLEIVGPKLLSFVEKAKEYVGKGLAKVYCWRGGMRSSSMAWLLQTAGLKVCILQYGYKAFRRWVLHSLVTPRQLAVVGGLTGCGKTEILQQLLNEGHQVLDLEAIAKHRGSSFGVNATNSQPSNEQFENEIGICWQSFDAKRPIWIEDESRMIGRCKIPDALFKQMRSSPLFVLETNPQVRIKRLLRDYGSQSIINLIAATKRIERKLGLERTQQVIRFLQDRNLEGAIEILLNYYDKSYSESLKNKQQPILSIQIGLETKIEKLYEAYEAIKNNVQFTH